MSENRAYMRILLIEDNKKLSDLLRGSLVSRDFSVEQAFTLEDATDRMRVTSYDALILDLGMPKGDGISWMQTLPEARAPILILSARHTLDERILGLNKGADDYLVKPADIEEIVARLRALLRRPGTRKPVKLRIGPISFDPVTRSTHVNDKAITLSRKESIFLEQMLKRKESVVTREILESCLYGLEEPVTPNALEAVASRLRKSLAEGGAPAMLHTVRGVGYYLGLKEQ